MNTKSVVFVPLWMALASLPPLADAGHAQDAIRPADEIRVVQTLDRRTGRTVRDVVAHPSPAEVLRVQVELGRSGYDPGLRSGVIDEPTRRALRRFQIARGFTICGCLTYETILALGIRFRVVDHDDGAHGSGVHARNRVHVVVPGPPVHARSHLGSRTGHGRHGVRAGGHDHRALRHRHRVFRHDHRALHHRHRVFRHRHRAHRHGGSGIFFGAGSGVFVGHAPAGRVDRFRAPAGPGRQRIVIPSPSRGRSSTLRAVPRSGSTAPRR